MDEADNWHGGSKDTLVVGLIPLSPGEFVSQFPSSFFRVPSSEVGLLLSGPSSNWEFTSSRDLFTSLNSEIPTSEHSGTRHEAGTGRQDARGIDPDTGRPTTRELIFQSHAQPSAHSAAERA